MKINPAKMQVGITKVKKISKGGILVELNTEDYYEKLEES